MTAEIFAEIAAEIAPTVHVVQPLAHRPRGRSRKEVSSLRASRDAEFGGAADAIRDALRVARNRSHMGETLHAVHRKVFTRRSLLLRLT